MKISELTANPNNPRTITDAKLSQFKKALREFGSLSGIVFNKKSNQLVCGHQHQKVLGQADITITKKFSKPTKTGTIAEGFIESGTDRFPYREVYWDDKKEKAANIAANKGAGSWDMEELAQWMQDLSDNNFDLDLTMFDVDELKEFDGILVGEHTRSGPTGVYEDEVPEVVPPRSKLGDLYLLGDHRLLCGDSTKESSVARLMKGEKADMVFTDPPYGMFLDTDYSKMAGTGKKHRKVIGDNEDFKPELIQTLLGVFSYCSEVFLFGADYYVDILVNREKGSWIVWDKRSKGEEYIGLLDNAFGSDFEMVWSKSKHQRKIARILKGNGWQTMKTDEKSVHPTQKPVALAEWFFENWGDKCNKIVDLFGGSGSTLIACEKTHRRCFMCEIDPHYCDVIISRWEKYTGGKAKLVARTKTRPVKQEPKQEV